ncbi:hypothetical protein FB45DRAFT_1040096 [Roridomyces roridus]|uniref:Uncharacterized protein n=1 Tax=Roridomyces roridus TaxID=1738132 RepID=A0AAD7B2A9_9AGAR|nr:hypothetical protein FB45DRAFT_1040096 [Roridomyces roridus]
MKGALEPNTSIPRRPDEVPHPVFILALATTVSAFTGPATFFVPNGGAGTCGHTIHSGDFAVALNPSDYARGAHCGKAISITCA